MIIPFKEIDEKHHMVCGAFLFYRLRCGLYRKYIITGMFDDGLIVQKVR